MARISDIHGQARRFAPKNQTPSSDLRLQMPAQIRVGYLDYTVEAWPPSHASTSERMGECDRQNSIIRVRDDLPPQRKAEVLLHEVLHAAYDMGCISGDDEEKIVSAFGHQLTQIWRDNPELIQFMEKTFR